MEVSQGVKGLQSFLGRVNNLTCFILHVSDLTKMLHKLLKADNDFVWVKHHQTAFQRIEDAILKDTALRYYDAKQDLYLGVGASKLGLGTVILQSQTDQIPNNADNDFIPTNLQPVAYASKSLTASEQDHVNIEREFLAVLHWLEKFYHFTYTWHVHVIAYHKLLLCIQSRKIIFMWHQDWQGYILECTNLI